MTRTTPASPDTMAADAFKVSSFTSVGHLLHINLKDHLVQHKYQIGEALLKKNNRALAVVNKINTIDNTYRNFDIEVIAKREGCVLTDEELMIVEVNENKCRFQLDFSKVYWNSRLSTEHERILGKLNKSHDVVFDLFSGVGPFAVPAAKAKCMTYANDLNPEAVEWLNENMKRNKVQKEFFEIYNIDAKDFILNLLREKLVFEYKRVIDEELATKPKIHILMNLPALAPTFLPHFIGLFKDGVAELSIDSDNLLEMYRRLSLEHTIYCYCFLKGVFEDPKGEVRRIVEEKMGRELTDNQVIDIFRVRNVAPYKDMYRIDIRLDEAILFDVKNLVGIMKNSTSRLSLNGNQKKVTINAPNGKRALEDSSSSLDESRENNVKRTRVSEYCNLM